MGKKPSMIIKRDGSKVLFDPKKIELAITKALISEGVASIFTGTAQAIAESFESENETPTIKEIEEYVFKSLCEAGLPLVAKAYEGYRSIREFQRSDQFTDESILSIVAGGTDEDLRDENSNKNVATASTQRDMIAGEASKDIAMRHMLPPHVVQAHKDGLIHFHDLDYAVQRIFNCFSGTTRFITSDGVKQFNDFNDGDEIQIIDMDGKWRNATVRLYGKRTMQYVTITSGRTKKVIKCTPDHRWILKDGSVTTNLKVGDRLKCLSKTEVNVENFDKYFCLGFVLGDGSDAQRHNESKYWQLRLCGDKTRYKNVFVKNGFKASTHTENSDVFLTKRTEICKQDFLTYKMWKILPKEARIQMFLGLYAADGSKDRNYIATTDERIVEFIKDTSALAGFHITRCDLKERSTNYKENALLYHIGFMKNQPDNRNWIVQSIVLDKHKDSYDAWCVEEPITHSFTLEGGIVTGNCCLVDLRGPFKDGTVINKKMIETPKSFRTACTVATQIVQQVACGQYGGQTISLAHLAPYVRVSYEKIKNQVREELFGDDVPLASPTKLCGNREVEHIAKKRLRKEIEDGLQTIQYQVNTFSTSNGQAPFLSIFMYLNEDPEYIEETAMLIEEMIKQRYIGMKNEAGVYVTPAFPKLLYVLDENNVPKDSKYRYLTDLAVKCVARRMMPDFISAKKMKENYEDVFPCMGCRSFLSQYRDKDGKLKWYNRFNQGVVTLNLADAGLSADGNIDAFWKILDERLELVHDGLMCKHKSLLGTKAEKSPIHWQHGVIARLKKDDVIDPYLKDGYSTLSLGYIGLHECVLALIGESHTTERGEELAVRIMRRLRKACDDWRAESGLGFSLYGSPSESTTYRLAQTTQKRFGVVKGITDRDYLTNSYHVDVTEKINAFDKLRFESQFQKISSGGCISYVEVPNLEQNLEVIDQLVSYMYETIQYAEINTKSDYCAKCGFRGEIKLNNNLDWECPQCHTVNRDDLTVCRRTCGLIA